jgi:hypothetical protein
MHRCDLSKAGNACDEIFEQALLNSFAYGELFLALTVLG